MNSKNIFIFLVLTFLVSKISIGQSVCSYISTDKTSSYYFQLKNTNLEEDDISAIVHEISGKVGLSDNFILQHKDGFKNAAAYTDNNGLRAILYDRSWLTVQSSMSQTGYWAVIFILAHEIGHHLNGHTTGTIVNLNERRNQELEADRFAGFILKKMGGKQDDIDRILGLTNYDLFSYDSDHPVKIDRISAANEGFNKATVDIEKNKPENQEAVTTAFMVKLETLADQMQNKSNKIFAQNGVGQVVDPRSIKGAAFKEFDKFSGPSMWYVASRSQTYLSPNKCYLIKSWVENYNADRAPAQMKQYYYGRNVVGKVYAQYTPDGSDVTIFRTENNNPKGALTREKNLFGCHRVIKNVNDKLFPEKIYTNKENSKFLYQIFTGDADLPYCNTFIDIEGYKKMFDCLSDTEKKKYSNPDEIIKYFKGLSE